jgi:hypothetical protein
MLDISNIVHTGDSSWIIACLSIAGACEMAHLYEQIVHSMSFLNLVLSFGMFKCRLSIFVG